MTMQTMLDKQIISQSERGQGVRERTFLVNSQQQQLKLTDQLPEMISSFIII